MRNLDFIEKMFLLVAITLALSLVLMMVTVSVYLIGGMAGWWEVS